MADPFGALKGYVDQKISSIESRLSEVLYGTVTQTEPSLTVRLSDGTLLTDTQSLEPILRPGDQVRLAKHGGFLKGSRVVILGKVATLPYRIPAGADLNGYTMPGQWYNPLNAEVARFTNSPPSGAAGSLVVLEAAGVIQYWHDFNTGTQDGNVWRRRYYNGSWSPWELFGGPQLNPKMWVTEVNGGQRTGGTFYNVSVTFPTGFFTSKPRAFAQINNQDGGGNLLQVMTSGITTTGMKVGFFVTTGSLNAHWCLADLLVIQPTGL